MRFPAPSSTAAPTRLQEDELNWGFKSLVLLVAALMRGLDVCREGRRGGSSTPGTGGDGAAHPDRAVPPRDCRARRREISSTGDRTTRPRGSRSCAGFSLAREEVQEQVNQARTDKRNAPAKPNGARTVLSRVQPAQPFGSVAPPGSPSYLE